MQKSGVAIIAFLVSCVGISSGVLAEDTHVIVEQHAISVSIDRIVQEDIVVRNMGFENITLLRFWVQQPIQGSIDVLAVNTATLIPTTPSGNMQTCNLSLLDLEIPSGETLRIRLTYTLASVDHFDKTLTYTTNILSLEFNNKNLFEGKEVTAGSSFSLSLYTPSQEPLDLIWIIAIMFCVLLFVFLSLFLLRRQRLKAKKSVIETEEILTTKKTLLLSLLKDLEKQYRAKEISDDTYQKLKEEFKQQAVLVMKKVDDLQK